MGRPRHYVVFPDGGITKLMPKKYACAHALLYDGRVKTHDPSWFERMEAKARGLTDYLPMLRQSALSGFWLIVVVIIAVAAGYVAPYLLAHAILALGG